MDAQRDILIITILNTCCMSRHFLEVMGYDPHVVDMLGWPRPIYSADSEYRLRDVESTILEDNLANTWTAYAEHSYTVTPERDVLSQYVAKLPDDMNGRLLEGLQQGVLQLANGTLQARYVSALYAVSQFIAQGASNRRICMYVANERLRCTGQASLCLTSAVAAVEGNIPAFNLAPAPTLTPYKAVELAALALQRAYDVTNIEPYMWGDAHRTAALMAGIVKRVEHAALPQIDRSRPLILPRFEPLTR